MALDRDNSIESFEICGFTTQQAEHLSRLSNELDEMVNKKQAPSSHERFLFYQKRIEELSAEINYYWDKYQNGEDNEDKFYE